MPEILACTEALATIPALRKTAIVTDGRFSGATRGPCVGHVSPEAIRGGSIALVEDGDLILIDIPQRVLAMVGLKGCKEKEREIQTVLAQRRLRWKPLERAHPNGILKRYATKAASAMQGAFLSE
jgi:dihydroxy-acid dehydratase